MSHILWPWPIRSISKLTYDPRDHDPWLMIIAYRMDTCCTNSRHVAAHNWMSTNSVQKSVFISLTPKVMKLCLKIDSLSHRLMRHGSQLLTVTHVTHPYLFTHVTHDPLTYCLLVSKSHVHRRDTWEQTDRHPFNGLSQDNLGKPALERLNQSGF